MKWRTVIPLLFAFAGLDRTLADGLIFPQFVSGELGDKPNSTRIILRNNGLLAETGQIRFLSVSGLPLEVTIGGEAISALPYSLPPLGTLDVRTDGTGTLVNGVVEVQADNPGASSLEGSLIYEVLGSRVSVTASPLASAHRLYVSVSPDENTGVAAFNPHATAPVTVRLSLLDNQGVNQTSKDLTLEPRQHLARLLTEAEFFPDFLQSQPEGFQGTLLIDVTSGDRLAVMGLIQDHTSGALVAMPSGTATFSTIASGQIVDRARRPLQLRGINLGGWLVPEGYMLQVPGYGSPTAIRDRIVDLIGEEGTNQFFELYRANYVTEEDIKQIAAWGFNSVRVPFHYRVLYDPVTESFLDSGFGLLARLLGWCRTHGLYAILDMHCAPGGQNKDNISDSDGFEARLWTEQGNQDLTVKIWTEIARRFAHEEWLLGYDLLNEPVLPSEEPEGYTNAILRDLYIRITTEIRKFDPHHLVFIEGNRYATDFSLLTPPFDSRLVYSFHKYWNDTSSSTLQSFLAIRQSYDVPLWLGEFGENSNQWGYEVVKAVEENHIGWCWWPHKKLETITSPLSASSSPGYQAIVDYWNGKSAKPSAEEARTALFQLAADLALAKCRLLPDVLRSLTDPSFGQTPQPYGGVKAIPGVINAVDFDTGAEGIAYHDAVSKRVTYDNWKAWNEGWVYRNDGVDIERSTDPGGFGYNVGWIEDGEWLSYSVDVSSAGTYAADIRTASAGGGGILRLSLDGTPLGPDLVMPPTGGWQEWRPVSADGLSLPAGRHTLKLEAVKGGFNLNRLEFRKTG
ncbi:MAG: cellulase family glycosylhydrolase [Acidobacteriota bacterium]